MLRVGCLALALLLVACGDNGPDEPGPAMFQLDGGIAPQSVALADPELEPCAASVGPFAHLYDPSPSLAEPWYINDHSIIRGQDGLWHLFGITSPEGTNPMDERIFAHATSPTLSTPTWTRQAPALLAEGDESLLWAPYVLFADGVYHMFYAAGGKLEAFQIKRATSIDLWHWQRDEKPLFRDGAYARDPHVMRIGEQWVMYYTATDEPDRESSYVVAYRTSPDLVRWSARKIAFRDRLEGREAGPTESPFVVARPEGFYLFIGPRRDDYACTDVFFSRDPFHFEWQERGECFDTHAPEIVEDLDGSSWITHSGWRQGGVHIAPLTWNCE